MSDSNEDNRLPPPAFPPGSRKHVRKNSVHPHHEDGEQGSGADKAFIYPDEPFPPRRDAVQRAFIEPDEPLPHRPRGEEHPHDPRVEERPRGPRGEKRRAPADVPPGRGRTWTVEDEGVAMGLGDDQHLPPEAAVGASDPYVAELVEAVEKLAEALRRKGEAGLHAAPGMPRFEATLRAYCVGYLAGRRAEGARADV